MKTVSVLGCGWLGLPLAEMLEGDYRVKGSTTSSSKLRLLEAKNIKPYLIKVDADGLQGDVADFFETDILYLNMPPGRRSQEELQTYPKKIAHVLKAVKDQTKVIFISSTGVYPNNNAIASEADDLKATSPSGQILIDAEECVRSMCDNWIILRMSGLVGPQRNPGKWFAGKKNIPNGEAPVNLVHLDDCLHISNKVIQSDISNEVYNICTDEHPSRMDFYSLQSKKSGLEIPKFLNDKTTFKIISNVKVKEHLGVEFKHPDPMRF